MNEELKKLIENKIEVCNIFTKQSGFSETASSKQYHELYGIKQACSAIGCAIDYYVDENDMIILN